MGFDPESAWEAFLDNEVTIDAFFESFGLKLATEDASFWRADLADPAKLGEFVALGLTSPSFDLSEGMAALCDGARRFGEALELRLASLPKVPRWYPDAAGRALGNIAEDLRELGRLEDAIRFGERALAWDPSNPFVIGTLANAFLQLGRLEDAFSRIDYLNESKWPKRYAREEFDRTAKARGARRPAGTPAYRVELGARRELSEDEELRALACLRFDSNNSDPGREYRAHAVIFAMSGRYGHAQLAAELLAAVPRGMGPEAEATVVWGRSLAAAIKEAKFAGGKPGPKGADEGRLLSADHRKALAYIAEATKAGRLDIVREAWFDPRWIIRHEAAKFLAGSEPSPLQKAEEKARQAMLEYVGSGDQLPRVKLTFPAPRAAASARKGAAPEKAALKPKAYEEPLRGEALARQVIAALETANPGKVRAHGVAVKHEPLLAAVVNRLRFPGDKPLPPSLRAFLTFDAGWVDLFSDLKKPAVSPMSLADLLAAEFREMLPDGFPKGFRVPPGLTGDFYPLPRSGDQVLTLYVGKPDSVGEYPVLAIDPGELRVFVRYAGFDAYLAAAFRVSDGDIPTDEQEKLNLGGREIALMACFAADSTWASAAAKGSAAKPAKKGAVAKGAAKPAKKTPAVAKAPKKRA